LWLVYGQMATNRRMVAFQNFVNYAFITCDIDLCMMGALNANICLQKLNKCSNMKQQSELVCFGWVPFCEGSNSFHCTKLDKASNLLLKSEFSEEYIFCSLYLVRFFLDPTCNGMFLYNQRILYSQDPNQVMASQLELP
jgi:hypothetical protein